MNSDFAQTTYHDLSSVCSKIDRRNTNYRFDADVDVPWDRIEEPGLHFGPRILWMLGIDVKCMNPNQADAFQWAYAMAICESFHRLEEMVIRFVMQENSDLGPHRSVTLLQEEELKHIALFERYAEWLRSSRPSWAASWEKIPHEYQAIPGSPEDRDSYTDRPSYHYVFWINTLFFEEFTLFLHECLKADRGLIYPTWASLHECHMKEEVQHLSTDVAYLKALALSQLQRETLSKAFFFRLEAQFEVLFGLRHALNFVANLYPDANEIVVPPFRQLPLFGEFLSSRTFRRSREAAPYISSMAKKSVLAQPSTVGKPSYMAGESLTKVHDVKLPDLIRRSAREAPEATITYLRVDGSEVSETYLDLLARAERISSSLRLNSSKHSKFVLLLLECPREFVGVFWACQLSGLVPVPLAAPTSSNGLIKDERVIKLLDVLETPLVVTDSEIARSAPPECQIIATEQLEFLSISTEINQVAPDEIALLQFSSGSTSEPRGAVITQRNAVANLKAITKYLDVTADDRVVSWMPLNHDMGLCLHLASVYSGLSHALMPPKLFVRRPKLWLEKIQESGATITASPNFGLVLCARKLARKNLTDMDLSSVRCILNGAEPISPASAAAFNDLLRPAGLKHNAMLPCYGLAEATTAVTLTRPGDGLKTLTISRASLTEGSAVDKVPSDGSETVRLVSVGEAIPGMEIRITDRYGTRVSDHVVGEIEVRGPNVVAGYWKDTVASTKLCHGDWIRTGDLGFVFEHHLYVAGRKKDVIFVNGRKFLAEDLEDAVRCISEVSGDRVAVLGRIDPGSGSEQVIVFLHQRIGYEETHRQVANIISDRLADLMKYPVHRIIFLQSDELPLTSSGKIQRYRLRDAFERGEFDGHDRGYDPHSFTGSSQQASPEPLSPPPIDREIEWVRTVWSEVLNRPLERIGIDQNFFDLGGTSLQAIEIHGCLEDDWGELLDQRILLDCRTVREQAEFLKNLSRNDVNNRSRRANLVSRQASERDIAVIAMAGRFPGAQDLEGFWQILREGRCVYGEPPADRWNPDEYYHPDVQAKGKTVCRTASFLDGIKEFDAAACGLPEEEALQIDPQQRLFLEIVLDLLDQAHVGTRNVGIFAGAAENEYFSRNASVTERINRQSAHANLANMLSARLSQLLRLTGPSITLDAACATSLVAVHYACRSLQNGECNMAIAGGVQLNLSVVPQLMFSQAGVLSERGRCQPYAKDADGFVPGEGAGAVLLKPLVHAIRDNDSVLGVICGSAINNDGGAMSQMAPNPHGQVEVISAALEDAGIKPEDIGYVEGHGAGTRIGDLVEVRALTEAYADTQKRSVGLGSVKSNVGHLFHTAGVCSLIKVLLALKHGEIPPTAGCEEPYPQIQFDRTPFFPVQSVVPWPDTQAQTRFAGISAFGVGGTNCHLIVGAPPERKATVPARERHLLCLSAPGPEQLIRMSETFARAIEVNNDLGVADFCASANLRASRFRFRSAMLVGSRQEAVKKLREDMLGVDAVNQPRLVCLFSGPAGQFSGMGQHLLDEPEFSRAVDECDSVLQPLLGCSVRELLTSVERKLDQIENAQPTCFVFGYATARWLQSLGVVPDAVLGHSGGEYAAACIAGVMSVEDAARLSYLRGRAMQEMDTGRMAVVYASESVIRAHVADCQDVEVACINSPGQCVVSGQTNSVETVLARLKTQNIRAEFLNLSCAAHSRMMRDAKQLLREDLLSTTMESPEIPFFSTVSGRQKTDLDSDYWLDQLTAPVLFESAVRATLDAGFRHYIDLGPSAILSHFVRETAFLHQQDIEHAVGEVHLFPIMRRSNPGWDETLFSLGRLFEHGVPLDSFALDGSYRSGAVLPGYPYDRKTLWIDPPPLDHKDPGLGSTDDLRDYQPTTTELDLSDLPSIRDHRVHGRTTAPSALLLDFVLNEVNQESFDFALEDILIGHPLSLPHEGARQARLRRSPADGRVSVVVETRNKDDSQSWIPHLSAYLAPKPSTLDQIGKRMDLPNIMARCQKEVSANRLKERLALTGMEYGKSLDTIAQVWVGKGEAITRLRLNETSGITKRRHTLHPGLVDGAIRSISALTPDSVDVAGATFLGFAIKRVRINLQVTSGCYAHLRLAPGCVLDNDCEVIRYDVTLADMDGSVLAELEEVSLKRQEPYRNVDDNETSEPKAQPGRLYVVDWKPAPVLLNAGKELDPGTTLIIGEPTMLRLHFEQHLRQRNNLAFALAPPHTNESWEAISTGVFADLLTNGVLRIVLMASDVEELACLSKALLNSGVKSLDTLLVVSPAAAVMAFLRSLSLEHPNWACRGIQANPIDLDVSMLYQEACAKSDDLVVSYRVGKRFVPALTAIEPSSSRSTLRRGGVYWITGGMGSLGRVIAEAVAQSEGARLLLTGRRKNPDEKVLERIKAVGGDVLYLSCDTTDSAAMQRARELVLTRWGGLNGVVHAAGSVEDVLVFDRDENRSKEATSAKLEGARVLAETTKDDNLDFIVFFSSLVALTGMPGQSDYASANAAMDELAHGLHTQGRKAKSLNWGPWAIGMASDSRYQRVYKKMRLRPFTAATGTTAFLQALSCSAIQIAVVDIEADYEGELLSGLNRVPLTVSTSVEETQDKQDKSSALEVTQQVKSLIAQHLHCPADWLETSTAFRELGMDSLMAVEIALAIQNYLGVPLQPTLLLELRTITELTSYLQELVKREELS